MSLVGEARPDWDGGCVLRIRNSLAALVEAAGRNLVVIGLEDCDAAHYGFPRELMAKDFRTKALTLAGELPSPGGSAPVSRPPADYPVSADLHIDLRCALDWLAEMFGQQMRHWGWDSDDVDETPSPKLSYSIDKKDLAKLLRCHDRLDEAIARHPAPSEDRAGSASSAAGGREDGQVAGSFCFETPLVDDSWCDLPRSSPVGPGVVRVHRPDGTGGTCDLTTAQWWDGELIYDPTSEWTSESRLYRSSRGRWILWSYTRPAGALIFDEIPAPERYELVDESVAASWFLDDWSQVGRRTSSMPPDIRARIERMDIDGEGETPTQAGPVTSAPPAQTQIDSGLPTAKAGKKLGKRWEVIAAYHARLARNESLSDRAIAKEVGCSAGYVNRSLKAVRPSRRDAAPRGFKSEDGGVEAIV